MRVFRAAPGVLLLFFAAPTFAGGLIGDAITWIGDRTGLQPVQQLGRDLDTAHAELKNLIPPYGAIEEQGSELVRRQFLFICESAYQAVTQPLIAYCSNYGDRLHDGQNILNAVSALEQTGLFRSEEFNGVDIRVCPIGTGAEGIAPDSGRIYVQPEDASGDPVSLGSLLAHEMTHIRQYRNLGPDRFKCAYSQAYVGCGFCQDDSNSFEREAYDFGSKAFNVLSNYYSANGGPPAGGMDGGPIFHPDLARGRVVIVNQEQGPITFWLESASAGPTQLWLQGQSWSTYFSNFNDDQFNIRLLTDTPSGTVSRSYGIRSGGTYYVGWASDGVADLFVDPATGEARPINSGGDDSRTDESDSDEMDDGDEDSTGG